MVEIEYSSWLKDKIRQWPKDKIRQWPNAEAQQGIWHEEIYCRISLLLEAYRKDQSQSWLTEKQANRILLDVQKKVVSLRKTIEKSPFIEDLLSGKSALGDHQNDDWVTLLYELSAVVKCELEYPSFFCPSGSRQSHKSSEFMLISGIIPVWESFTGQKPEKSSTGKFTFFINELLKKEGVNRGTSKELDSIKEHIIGAIRMIDENCEENWESFFIPDISVPEDIFSRSRSRDRRLLMQKIDKYVGFFKEQIGDEFKKMTVRWPVDGKVKVFWKNRSDK